MAKKLAKFLGWFVVALLGLGLATYCVLLIVNLHDQPRSPVIDELLEARQGAPSVGADDNSYIYVLGFSGPPKSDPMVLGRRRHEWMASAAPDFDPENDPLKDDYNFRSLRHDAVSELSDTCSEPESECLHLLSTGQTTVVQWLADEGWLLERYNALVNMRGFQEDIPFEILSPLPPYDVVFESQRLFLVDAWLSAQAGDATSVRAKLDSDLTYWRMVLRNSDALITKMIATSAIVRHFKLGNLVLRSLPQDEMSRGLPPSWRIEISDEERSMQRCLAGEWSFFVASTRGIVDDFEDPKGHWLGLEESSMWDRFAWFVLKPFWQQQDNSNLYAHLMLGLANAFDVPYDEVAAAVEVADTLHKTAYRKFSRLYNLTGDFVLSSSFWTVSNYAVRVSDLEGIRRAALLAAELRAVGTPMENAVDLMLVSEIVDPYTNEPLAWHPDGDAIVFQGLARERSQHKILY